MYGRILGFHRLVRCPKWTPASMRSCTTMLATSLCSFCLLSVRMNTGTPVLAAAPRSADHRRSLSQGILPAGNAMIVGSVGNSQAWNDPHCKNLSQIKMAHHRCSQRQVLAGVKACTEPGGPTFVIITSSSQERVQQNPPIFAIGEFIGAFVRGQLLSRLSKIRPSTEGSPGLTRNGRRIIGFPVECDLDV